MVSIKVPGKLSIIPEYYFEFLEFAETMQKSQTTGIVLNFPAKTWTYPCGIVLLAQYAHAIKQLGQRILCKRMPRYLTEAIRCDIASILSLTTITDQRKTEETSEKTLGFMKKHHSFKEGSLDSIIQENLDEMMSNAFQHSGRQSVSVYGQYYKTKREVILSVLDIGIGIPNHIRKKYNPDKNPGFENDAFCIQKATELGFTGSSFSKNSGVGLYDLKDIMKRTRNNLRIISGNGYFECIAGKERTGVLPIFFNGTLIDFQILLDEPVEIEPAKEEGGFPF